MLWIHRQDWVLGSRHSPIPLLPPSVLSACVTHTDGNNFFQPLEEVGEARSLPCVWGGGGGSLSRSPSPSVSAAKSFAETHSLAAAFLILCLPCGRGLAF